MAKCIFVSVRAGGGCVSVSNEAGPEGKESGHDESTAHLGLDRRRGSSTTAAAADGSGRGGLYGLLNKADDLKGLRERSVFERRNGSNEWIGRERGLTDLVTLLFEIST